MVYTKGDENLWTGRIDDTENRAHFRNFQVVDVVDLEEIDDNRENEQIEDYASQYDVGILGYAVDRGVYLNQGRVGAQQGPDAIREKFGNMALMNDITIGDFGNISTDETYVENVQTEYADMIKKSHSLAKFHMLLGGGHDISYAHYKGLRQIYPHQSIGVINIDAHFDLRDAEHETSGTGFKQIIDEDPEAGYLVLGIQQAGNTQHLFNIANDRGVEYVLAEHIDQDSTNERIASFIDKYDVIMLTLCLDVIDSAYAPGVSAPCSFGLSPKQVYRLILEVLKYDKTQHISIAEMNPKYDIDERTAKMVGHIMFRILHRNSNIE
ncbi:formimidoylglutamase [Macrococcoides goetzii]|nr:formimidoylglutamase [Macrococcus goetzii]